MKIGYGKLGRSMPLTLARCGNLGGDVECVAVVKELALLHPDDTFYLLGRNSGERPERVGLPSNVVNPWITWSDPLKYEMKQRKISGGMSIEQHLALLEAYDSIGITHTFAEMDGHVWWVGQHGSSNSPIPMTDGSGQLTKPHDSYAFYAGFVFRGLNAWRDKDPWTHEEVYLNADPRNRHKMRDLKWPLTHPVLTQYNFNNRIKHERHGDASHFEEFSAMHDVGAIDRTDGTWRSTVHNIYSRLEINGLAPGTPFGDLISYDDNWERPGRFGLFINEARAIGIQNRLRRVKVVKDWVMPLEPHFIHGTWSNESMLELGRPIAPAPWDRYFPSLHSVRCTFTTPSSGSGWATAKPWEAFAGGTVCFFHPEYDTQDNILGDAPDWLRRWLRVKTPEELAWRVAYLSYEDHREDWEKIVRAQREHFDRAMAEKRYLRLIEERLYG